MKGLWREGVNEMKSRSMGRATRSDGREKRDSESGGEGGEEREEQRRE